MKATSLFVVSLAIATVSIASGTAAPKKRAFPHTQAVSSDVYNPAMRAKVLDPDVRIYGPATARTYQECREKLKAQGVGSGNWVWYICSSMGYKS
jgi:hypothetical protein